MEITSPSCTGEQQRFVLEARRALLDELLAVLIDQVPLLALTGQPGVGKTTIVSAIQQELSSQAIDVLRVGCGERGRIDLRALACQLLGKPDTEFTADDVERVFDLLITGHKPRQRRVMIIDGAEQIRGDALGYLHLLSGIAGEAMPQIVLVGRPSFLEASDGTTADLLERVTIRRDLAPLTVDEARQFIDLSPPLRALRPEVREALIRHADGSIGRLAALLTLTGSICKERRRRRVTEGTVDLAVARLDTVAELASEPAPVADLQEDHHPHRASARTSVLVGAAVLLIVSPGSWQAGEKGVRLSTLAAALDGRGGKPITLATTAAREAVKDHVQAFGSSLPALISDEAPPLSTDNDPNVTDVRQLPSTQPSNEAGARARDNSGAPDVSSPQVERFSTPPQTSAHLAPAPTGQAGSQEQHNVVPAAIATLNLGSIVSRGDDLLALGDITAARLYYERAATMGSAAAATLLGKTYDPLFLAAIRASGVLPDRDQAALWYRKAIALGDGKAEPLLARMTAAPGPR